MKKLFTILALTTIVFVSNAQRTTKTPKVEIESYGTTTSEYKPMKGSITAEVGLIGGLNNANYTLLDGAFRLRYFVKNDLAVRLGLAIGNSNSESTNVTVSPAPTTTTTTKTTSRIFNIGAEKHFKGTDRLSTYVGADILFGFNGASLSQATSDGTFFNVDGATSPAGANRAGSSFGFRVVTGADYYIAKKLYLGVEVGLGYTSGSTDSVNQSVKTTPNGTTTDTKLFSDGKLSRSSTNVIGGVRIGYQF